MESEANPLEDMGLEKKVRIKRGRLGYKTRKGKMMGRPKKPDAEKKVREKKEVQAEKKTRKHRIDINDLVKRTITGLAKMGKTMDEIADIVGVSKTHLRRHFINEIRYGKAMGDALVVENLYQQAMKDAPSSIQAGIYLTKARMGWRDKEDDSKKGPSVVFNFSGLSYEERNKLIGQLEHQKTGGEIDLDNDDEASEFLEVGTDENNE
jgi:AraC-like DNA-binding protein